MALEGDFIFRFDDARGGGERGRRIAVRLVVVGRGRSGAPHVVEQAGGWRERRAVGLLPLGLQLLRRADGLLLALADHRDVIAAAHHADETGHARDRRLVDALQGRTRERGPHVARVDHAGHFHVHGPFQRAVDLGRDVIAFDGLPHHPQVSHGFDHGLARGRVDVAPL
jgi:hypothetical protein